MGRIQKWRLTDRIPQYNTLIRTSNGALHTDSIFFTKKSRRERVTSANRPAVNVHVDNARPIIVKKTKCQPKPSELQAYSQNEIGKLFRFSHSRMVWVLNEASGKLVQTSNFVCGKMNLQFERREETG